MRPEYDYEDAIAVLTENPEFIYECWNIGHLAEELDEEGVRELFEESTRFDSLDHVSSVMIERLRRASYTLFDHLPACCRCPVEEAVDRLERGEAAFKALIPHWGHSIRAKHLPAFATVQREARLPADEGLTTLRDVLAEHEQKFGKDSTEQETS